MSKSTRWSYSSVSTYRNCPAQWKFLYIDNIEWPSAPSAMRGTRMHKMAEDFLTGASPAVHHEIQKVGPLLHQMQMSQAKSEQVWMLDFDWKPTEDAGKAWVKSIIDVHYFGSADILVVKDFKSGQMYEDHREQLELYGLIGYCKYPHVKRVDTSAVYMDMGYEGNESSILPAMTNKLIAKWQNLAETMFRDEVHEPSPGPLKCKRCPYSKSKGGPCQY